ncbi:MFS transporter [Actinoplanes lobatus]|uniref:MFS transporter n=1 Tax=Actinoplanes lobatus TaxID=113568 RepID=A0A7W7HDM7_9ACTN|nr:MFS transporter [Actinoplanes lobatus]MBB4748222.1 putative MFS family arabinose efflux permease [Actinoplanes lobatus]GGN70257.1 MFS transporter [Actinoplanes lobatus]GIE40071.1 MFS transporter [Actinoplanes lobatus]
MSTVETSEPRVSTRSVYITFIFLGVAMATFASRIPQIRDHLGLSPSELGLVLLAIAAGSITSLPLAGHLVHRFGSRAMVGTMAVMLGVSLSAAAIGYHFGVVPVVVALYLYGFSTGAWDVAMNVQAAVVERKIGRSIMSRFHAGYSIGTVAGALVGAAVVKAGIGVTWHVVLACLLVTGAVVVSVRGFVPDETEPEPGGGTFSALAAWREPRTLLIGVFVLAFALTEGAGIDWINIALIDDYGTTAATGTLAFALFLAAMTVGRWYGPNLLDRYGRVPVLRALAVIGLGGLLIFVFGPSTPVAFAGALLWGLGASLGFPVGMSAAADEPSRAPARVGVVASIGYCAFLGGPPLIGFLGDHYTVSRGLLAVAMLLVLSIVLTPALREPDRAAGAARSDLGG